MALGTGDCGCSGQDEGLSSDSSLGVDIYSDCTRAAPGVLLT